MVVRAEVFRVADKILDNEGDQPTMRSIRERLVHRGSFSDIGPHFAAWAALRGLRLRPPRHGLPPHLLDKLATVAVEIWRDGLRVAGKAAHNEMDRLARERDAVQAVAVEAMAYLGFGSCNDFNRSVACSAAGVFTIEPNTYTSIARPSSVTLNTNICEPGSLAASLLISEAISLRSELSHCQVVFVEASAPGSISLGGCGAGGLAAAGLFR